nr:cation transporter [Dyadobacter sandarakinus]
MNPRQRRLQERKLIKVSIAIGSVLTLWAIGVGIAGDSKSIIFDALFSMVGLTLSGVSLFVNNFIRKPDDDNLPFGRSQFQPFAISLQSSVIIFLCLYSLATSVIDILMAVKRLNWQSHYPI